MGSEEKSHRRVWARGQVCVAISALLCLTGAVSAEERVIDAPMPMMGGGGIEMIPMCSPPEAPEGVASHIVDVVPQEAVMLSNVPTSDWTYGCSATSAGMMFGYYDRTGFWNMYTGPCNGGVAPAADLGGQCSIIATQNGFDGRITKGHVDDYWVSGGTAGPDPWEGNRAEHTWADCTADYMGTNQWKWDFLPWPNGNNHNDFNVDGSTALFTAGDCEKLYDYTPAAKHGLPQTALCHGLRLFAESRGYEVIENYTQKIFEVCAGGFTFEDYMAEIDGGYPVMIQVEGHSMVGVGYESSDQTVYLHDTWGDYVASMIWGESYSEMDHVAVTVIHVTPEPATMGLVVLGGALLALRRRRR